MASVSDSASPDAPSMASAFDQQLSISSTGSDTAEHEKASPIASGNQGGVDHLIQRRIKKIYKRLKETDANIKTMETLLDWRGEQGLNIPRHHNFQKEEPGTTPGHRRATSPKSERRLSTSSQSSLDVFEHSRGNSREPNLAKSVESLRGTGQIRSPTLKQLQRLTQSMQDLHNFQQRFQDDLKMEMRNISRNETRDVLNELSLFIKKHAEESMSCKEILGKLLELQTELKTNNNQYDFQTHVMRLVENLKTEMENLKYAMSSSPISTNASGLLQKLSNVESQQERLEHIIEILVKQMEIKNQTYNTPISHDEVEDRRKDAQVQDLQQQMEKNIRLTLETSRQLHQMSEEFQRIQLCRSSTGSDRDSGKHKAKQVVHKLRTRCEGLLIEKKHFEDMCHASEERVHTLLREKEVLLVQLDEFQNKLHHDQKELHDIKTKFVDDQMENLKKETTFQQFKLLYDNSLKNLASCHVELEQMKIANGKLSDENRTLHEKVDKLNREKTEQDERLVVTSNSLQELKTSGASAEHLKEKVALLDVQVEEAKMLHAKQLSEEKENNRLLRESLLDLKANNVKENADAALKKEAEFGPILALLKQQISDYQIQISNLQQENGNIAGEKSHMNRELLKVQSEIRDAHKKHEKLMKNYYSKDEALRVKIHEFETQEMDMADFRKVVRKMEQEYKCIISTINAEVDHTVQLWNKTSACTLQVLTPASGGPVHPKVQLVEIQSKLKWIQDDLCASLTGNEKILDSSPPTSHLPKMSVCLNKPSSNTNIVLLKPNILTKPTSDIPSGNMPRGSNLVWDDRKTYKMPKQNLPSLDLSRIAKDQQEDRIADKFKSKKDQDRRTKYLENNFKQLNSTEIESGSNLPINQLNSLCRNDIHTSKMNVDNHQQYHALSPHLSPIDEPSDGMSTDNQLDCSSSSSDL